MVSADTKCQKRLDELNIESRNLGRSEISRLGSDVGLENDAPYFVRKGKDGRPCADCPPTYLQKSMSGIFIFDRLPKSLYEMLWIDLLRPKAAGMAAGPPFLKMVLIVRCRCLSEVTSADSKSEKQR